MRRLFLALAMIFAVNTVLFSQTDSNRRYISTQNMILKDSTGFFARELGTLSLGNEVILLREQGKWAEVRAGNLTGWVSGSGLSARRIVAAGSSSTATELALAGKGFSYEMEAEYRKSGLDYSLVDSMEKMNIPSGELLDFIREGRLARGER